MRAEIIGQTGIMAVAEGGATRFYQVQTGEQVKFDRQPARQLEDAWTVVTLEAQEERRHLAACQELLTKARRVIINSGHIYWLRLAEGMVDAYLDPFGGEPLYEMFACSVAQQAGCVVTDIEGKPFDLAGQLKRFEEDRAARFYPVAARTPELHAQLLESLKRDS
jgi:fructose-1,6-bisphosphatase/inositol monophosphatase family enzyme